MIKLAFYRGLPNSIIAQMEAKKCLRTCPIYLSNKKTGEEGMERPCIWKLSIESLTLGWGYRRLSRKGVWIIRNKWV